MHCAINTGALWRSDNSANEKAPTLRGYIDIEGMRHRIVGWRIENGSSRAPTFRLEVRCNKQLYQQYRDTMETINDLLE